MILLKLFLEKNIVIMLKLFLERNFVKFNKCEDYPGEIKNEKYLAAILQQIKQDQRAPFLFFIFYSLSCQNKQNNQKIENTYIKIYPRIIKANKPIQAYGST